MSFSLGGGELPEAKAVTLPSGFEQVMVADGLDSPTSLDFAPDGRLFIAEQIGKLRIVKNGVLLPLPFLTIPFTIEDPAEQGLLGFVFDRNFENNGFIYVYYTDISTGVNKVSRFTASIANPDIADPNSEVVLLDNIPGEIWHNGGFMYIAPDQTLFIATGDALNSANSQNGNSLAGKILRINLDGTIPIDNPFVANPNIRDEVWALGFRQPFQGAVDPLTGRMHVNDTGQSSWEEINLVQKGANYGWPNCEGNCSNPNYINPIYAYNHSEGCAITGGAFYRDTRYPSEYNGVYFFSDYCQPRIRQLNPDNSVTTFATDIDDGPVGLKVAPDGNLYYISYGPSYQPGLPQDAVYKIQYGYGNRNPIAVAAATPTSGLAPLQVVFSAAGSSDPDGDPLSYTWDFGDGSATEQGLTATHTYQFNGPNYAKLTVADTYNGIDSETIVIMVGSPPTGSITLPAIGANFNAGDTIQFAGAGSDFEDGTLLPNAFSWTVELHHHEEQNPLHHTHHFFGPLNGVTEGSFQIPLQTHDADIFFRINLLLTDSDGLFHSISRDIHPNLSTLTFDSDPTGLTLRINGQTIAPPAVFQSIVNSTHTIEAVSPQFVISGGFAFQSWSDGGTTTHTIFTPAINTTYSAAYVFDPYLVDPSLVGHWKFDEGQGTTAFDSSLNLNHGALKNMEASDWGAGKTGGALSFDGTNESVLLPNTSSLNITSPITIAFWVKTNSGSSIALILGGYNDSSPWPGYGISLQGGKIAYWSSAHGSWVLQNSNMNDNQWHHFAVVVSGNTATFYKDGVADGSRISKQPGSYLGARSIAANNFGTKTFLGSLDDMRIYNRALTTQEIMELATAQ